jgi:ribulose-5-phosphate 4-epimerase/fuculose-1-phosphate aldolase
MKASRSTTTSGRGCRRTSATTTTCCLRNHGTLTVGRSVASAFERMYHLERACSMQVRTRALGTPVYPVEEIAIEKNTELLA